MCQMQQKKKTNRYGKHRQSIKPLKKRKGYRIESNFTFLYVLDLWFFFFLFISVGWCIYITVFHLNHNFVYVSNNEWKIDREKYMCRIEEWFTCVFVVHFFSLFSIWRMQQVFFKQQAMMLRHSSRRQYLFLIKKRTIEVYGLINWNIVLF